MNISQRQFALGAGIVTAAWYALPDAVRSRPVRTLAKAGLLAVSGYAVAQTASLRPSSDAFTDVEPTPAVLAGATAALGLGTALTIWTEKAIFAFGEKRRANGARLAHTVPALALGALAAAVFALEPEAVSAD